MSLRFVLPFPFYFKLHNNRYFLHNVVTVWLLPCASQGLILQLGTVLLEYHERRSCSFEICIWLVLIDFYWKAYHKIINLSVHCTIFSASWLRCMSLKTCTRFFFVCLVSALIPIIVFNEFNLIQGLQHLLCFLICALRLPSSLECKHSVGVDNTMKVKKYHITCPYMVLVG